MTNYTFGIYTIRVFINEAAAMLQEAEEA